MNADDMARGGAGAEDADADDVAVDDDTDDDDTDVTMDQRRVAGRAELWIAVAGLFMTIIGAIIGAAWWAGSTLATKADIEAIREDMREDRQRADDRLDAAMEELRGYIVDHLDGHPIEDQN